MEHWIRVEPNVKVYVNDLNPLATKTILFIHGWPANHQMFEYQYNQLVPMGYRCIGMDMRGFGRSDKPLGGYDYNRLADDIRCVIGALGLHNITLGGHSTGGAVAIRYMARHKGYGVSKLALFASAAPSLIQRPGFPYGTTREAIEQIIQSTYADRPKMLKDFGDIFFYQPVSQPFSDWFFFLGLEAASWSTIAVSNAWLAEELFNDLPGYRCLPLFCTGFMIRCASSRWPRRSIKGLSIRSLFPLRTAATDYSMTNGTGSTGSWRGSRDRFSAQPEQDCPRRNSFMGQSCVDSQA